MHDAQAAHQVVVVVLDVQIVHLPGVGNGPDGVDRVQPLLFIFGPREQRDVPQLDLTGGHKVLDLRAVRALHHVDVVLLRDSHHVSVFVRSQSQNVLIDVVHDHLKDSSEGAVDGDHLVLHRDDLADGLGAVTGGDHRLWGEALIYVPRRAVEHAQHGDDAVRPAVGAADPAALRAHVVDVEPDAARVLGDHRALV